LHREPSDGAHAFVRAPTLTRQVDKVGPHSSSVFLKSTIQPRVLTHIRGDWPGNSNLPARSRCASLELRRTRLFRNVRISKGHWYSGRGYPTLGNGKYVSFSETPFHWVSRELFSAFGVECYHVCRVEQEVFHCSPALVRPLGGYIEVTFMGAV